MSRREATGAVAARVASLGEWYHRIDLGPAGVTPGTKNQSLVFALYEPHLPDSLEGLSVLDLGCNACGLSVEFARRGARVTALDTSEIFLRQARLVVDTLGLSDRISLFCGDLFAAVHLGPHDIVAFVGLAYHLRHPQLALDVLGRVCSGHLLCSTQTCGSDGLRLENRKAKVRPDAPPGHLLGWEPTEQAFLEMVAAAGFSAPRLVSRAPHPGEAPGNVCGNAAYFLAEAPRRHHRVPYLDPLPAPVPFQGG